MTYTQNSTREIQRAFSSVVVGQRLRQTLHELSLLAVLYGSFLFFWAYMSFPQREHRLSGGTVWYSISYHKFILNSSNSQSASHTEYKIQNTSSHTLFPTMGEKSSRMVDQWFMIFTTIMTQDADLYLYTVSAINNYCKGSHDCDDSWKCESTVIHISRYLLAPACACRLLSHTYDSTALLVGLWFYYWEYSLGTNPDVADSHIVGAWAVHSS